MQHRTQATLVALAQLSLFESTGLDMAAEGRPGLPSYVTTGITAGTMWGFVSEVWKQPPTPVPSEVVQLKETPRSSWPKNVAKGMVRHGAWMGLGMGTFYVARGAAEVFTGEEHAMSYIFGGAVAGGVYALRLGHVTRVPLTALAGAATGVIAYFDTTNEDMKHVFVHHYLKPDYEPPEGSVVQRQDSDP